MALEETSKAEHINQLLSRIELSVQSNKADEAKPIMDTLNSKLKSWCESDTPPNTQELETIQAVINAISKQAIAAKNESLKAIIKQKKTGKAISAYKSV
ncbi:MULTISPECIES: hypothetical protein [unclassified Pseudoalteromonas]|uniref:hypothetical protein n=1 Tax=unclassified Pseudoalteromonas TaxID=194690 RepID=UPI00235891A3|nr:MULTISPECIES: hypothetical protein [unclassified Pseudoalteromonas]MDC9565177.1 hypothetical protein [Pseudoalteromonas sp. GAB2316C]MDC9567787.1 hypothetical protein [Pseudoalteromonas sp. GABNB9D]MDC9573594.1 hypothetical protein [Pseudoalteromonas sp. GABNS16A]MDC9577893.1 hypothetical protein [Pseudoalteromonas sp. GABNS16E]MDC9585546.1 hypothetical protein [Pseudoalteromonas sp. GABNS16C]